MLLYHIILNYNYKYIKYKNLGGCRDVHGRPRRVERAADALRRKKTTHNENNNNHNNDK